MLVRGLKARDGKWFLSHVSAISVFFQFAFEINTAPERAVLCCKCWRHMALELWALKEY